VLFIKCFSTFLLLTGPAFSRDFNSFEHPELAVEEHMVRYPLSGCASRYWFVHVRGGLEEKFVPIILKTFQIENVRLLVNEIANYSEFGYFLAPRIRHSHLLHTASDYGLPIMCHEILRPTNKIQKLCFLLTAVGLILAKRF